MFDLSLNRFGSYLNERLSNLRPPFRRAPRWRRHYDDDVPVTINIPSYPLTTFLQQSVDRYPDRPVLLYFGRKIGYAHFYELVRRCQTGLANLGVAKGDRVALISPNMPQFLIAYWAVLRLGAVVVLINPLLSEREISNQLRISRARVVLVLDRIVPRLQRIKGNTDIEQIIPVSVEAYTPLYINLALQIKKRILKRVRHRDNVIFFRKLLLNPPSTGECEISASDPAVILFTGGVTGRSKAVLLSHHNLVANTLQARAWIRDLRDGSEVFAAVLPFIHSYGMTTCNHLVIQSGATAVVHPRFRAKRVLGDLRKHRVTVFPGVPTLFAAMADLSGNPPADLRVCISGGAALNEDLRRTFEAKMGCRLVQGYGLTETSPITHCNPIYGRSVPDSIGLPFPNTEARIRDLDSGRILPPGRTGELEIRGPQVMLGYLEDEQSTAEVITDDGWFRSGDVAYCDRDGYFYIVDRKKDIILRGGNNIYPAEVEQVLCEHPAVAEAAVLGESDPYYGEAVHAFIVLKPGQKLASREIQTFCQDKLAKFKWPTQITFASSLPKNFLGKVIRRELLPPAPEAARSPRNRKDPGMEYHEHTITDFNR